MGNIYLIIAGCIIVFLICIITYLILSRSKNISQSEPGESIKSRKQIKAEKQAQAREERRRRRAALNIHREIQEKLEKQENLIQDLSNYLWDTYAYVANTETRITRFTNEYYHNELINLFDLDKKEVILYCRRYTRTFGSDSFFIILEDRIGYAPHRNPLGFIYFSEISEFRVHNGNIEVWGKNGECGYIDTDDFTYNGSGLELARKLNSFVESYKDSSTIYWESCLDALDEKAISIIPELIEKVEKYDSIWADFFRANYKYILCEDGISPADNAREASYAIENILKRYKEDDNPNLYNSARIVKAKLGLLNDDEDHNEVKKILDTVLASKCDSFVMDEAARVRRQIRL